MKNNLRIKRSLIIQSFAPLFLLLTIKYCNYDLYKVLVSQFISEIKCDFISTIIKTIFHPMFGSLFVFALGGTWIIVAIFIALGFRGIQKNGFKSKGEKILLADTENEGSAIFLVTYVLPLLTDDINSLQKLIVFLLMLGMIILLLINSKAFYHNPILVALKYKTYSFRFINPDSDIKDAEAVYICITHGNGISPKLPIKRKHIADGVFLIYND